MLVDDSFKYVLLVVGFTICLWLMVWVCGVLLYLVCGGGFVCALGWAHVRHWFEVFVLCVIVALFRSLSILIVGLWFMCCFGVPVALFWVLF